MLLRSPDACPHPDFGCRPPVVTKPRGPASPHFHAARQGVEAFVRIEDGEILHGKLPRKASRIVRQWALDHREALMANWVRGEMLLPMEMIPGADADD